MSMGRFLAHLQAINQAVFGVRCSFAGKLGMSGSTMHARCIKAALLVVKLDVQAAYRAFSGQVAVLYRSATA